MKVENPLAFRFILQDEIYLLPADKVAKSTIQPAEQVLARSKDTGTEDAIPPNKPVIKVEESKDQPVFVAQEPLTTEPALTTPAIGFNYLGANNSNFLILVDYPNHEHMADDHLEALQNILKRKNLGLNDVAILNVNKYAPIKLTDLAAHFNPTRLVIMGSGSLPQGIGKLPLNQPLQGKRTHVLYSFSFDEMMSSNDNKKIFWEHMKTL